MCERQCIPLEYKQTSHKKLPKPEEIFPLKSCQRTHKLLRNKLFLHVSKDSKISCNELITQI